MAVGAVLGSALGYLISDAKLNKQREIKTVVQTPKTHDARYRPILTNLNTDTGEKAAIVYENWRNNPNILVQAQPFSANQSFRNTHNHTYRNSI